MLEKIYNPSNNQPISPSLEKLKLIAQGMNINIEHLLSLMNNNSLPSINNKDVFSKNLKYYMAANNKTRSDIVNDLGLSYTTFVSWEKGDNYPRIDKIELLANYFKIPKSELIEIRAIDGLSSKTTKLIDITNDLTDQELDEVLNYIYYLKYKRIQK